MAKFEYTYEVCNCKKVTLGEIMCAIYEKDANSIADIGELTDAGTVCKYCQDCKIDTNKIKKSLYLSQILKSVK